MIDGIPICWFIGGIIVVMVMIRMLTTDEDHLDL